MQPWNYYLYLNFGLLGLSYNLAVDQVSAPLLPSGKGAGPAGVPAHLTHNRWPTFHTICQHIESSRQQPLSKKSPSLVTQKLLTRTLMAPCCLSHLSCKQKAAPCSVACWGEAATLFKKNLTAWRSCSSPRKKKGLTSCHLKPVNHNLCNEPIVPSCLHCPVSMENIAYLLCKTVVFAN